ncbi:hypothetical protein ACOSP7_017954 [Xanthoceras sorbifolium]
MRREIPPRILKLQQRQKQPLPPQLPPRMRRCLPPRLCRLQEEKLTQAAPQAHRSLAHQQNMFFQSLQARVERLSQLLKIQQRMLRTQQAFVGKLLIMHQQQEQRGQQFQQSALKEQQYSDEDYSRLLSFLGMEPAELTILMRQKASIIMRQRQLQEEPVGLQVRWFQKAIMRTEVPRENIEYKRLTSEEQIKSMGLEPGSFFSYSLPSNYVKRSPNS